MYKTLFTAAALICGIANAEQTLSIIKPDGVANHHIGEIVSKFENNGLQIKEMKMTTLTKKQAEDFYDVHRGRPFYDELTTFMSSGPVVIMVLDGNDAVAKNRAIMGATDPKKAEKGTIRAEFSKSMGENTVHGSDSVENAEKEIKFFFG